jgi:hypothetical protein
MGEITAFRREKLVVGILASSLAELDRAVSEVSGEFGEIDFASEPIRFTFTDYYTSEMGDEIWRMFVSLKDLVDPIGLPGIKIRTNLIEERYMTDGKRSVNLDPGLLDLNRLLLASTKYAGHRIPLADGIYAEITLLYFSKEFQDLFWTYPDFRTEEYKAVLRRIRDIYRSQIKSKE